MLLKRVSGAVAAVLVLACAAHAQSANDLRGPAELPPAGFTGQQFVDSRGCVFLKAGLSGRVSWVPRVSRDRRQLCGYPPSFASQKIDVVQDSAPAIAAETAKAQAKTEARAQPTPKQPVMPRVAAAADAQASAPRVAPAPARVARSAGAEGKPVRIGCYRDAPVAERFALRSGGSIVLCTRGDGNLDHARPPVLIGGRAAVAPSGFVERGAAPQSLPKGYRAAWPDDRFNPLRGKGTPEGQMAQDRVWTREVPARLVAETAPRGQDRAKSVRVSTKSAAEASAARFYVQVGSFGQPANAERAVARLAGLGLPVVQGGTAAAPGGLRVVLAGPFPDGGAARAALAAARRAGFADAFIR